jgi:hypothetical protein
MLRARSPRVGVVPGSPLVPIASSRSSVTCVVSICRCRAEGSALQPRQSTLPNQAEGVSTLPRCRSNGGLVYDGQLAHPVLQLVDGLVGHLQFRPGAYCSHRRSGRSGGRAGPVLPGAPWFWRTCLRAHCRLARSNTRASNVKFGIDSGTPVLQLQVQPVTSSRPAQTGCQMHPRCSSLAAFVFHRSGLRSGPPD